MTASIQYKLNVRFLIKLLVLVTVVGVGVYFAHRFQEHRLTSRYLVQANNARDEGKPGSELNYLRQYIQLNPTDNNTRVRYGQVMARYSRKPAQILEAYLMLQKSLQYDPNLPAELRLQCVKLALRPDVNLPGEARRELETLFKTDPDNSDYEALYADALIRTGEYPQAEEFLTKSINRSKNKIESYTRLAWVKRERNRASGESADLLMRQMLEQPDNEKNPHAWLRAAGYYRTYGPAKEYTRAIEKATALAPKDPEVVYAKTEHALTQWRMSFPYPQLPKATPELDVALKELGNNLLATLPTLPSMDPPPEYASVDDGRLGSAILCLRMLSRVNMQIERYDEAEKWSRMATKQFKDDIPQLNLDLLESLVAQKKYDEARLIASRLQSINFAPAQVEQQLGYIEFLNKKYIEAAKHLERATTELTKDPERYRAASRILALCYVMTGQTDQEAVTQRSAIPSNPLDPAYTSSKISYAESLVKLGRFSEAISNYSEVADKDPNALFPLISLLIAEKATQSVGARDWKDVQKYLAKLPPGPAAEIAHAQYLTGKGDIAGARARLEQAAITHPKSGEVMVTQFNLELREKQLTAAAAIAAKAEAALGDTAGVRQIRIALFTTNSGGDAKTAPDLEKLADIKKFNETERVFLLRMLSNSARTIGRRDLALKYLDELSTTRGEDDMDLQFAKFDLALLDGDEGRINKVIEDITRLTGKNSPTTRLVTAFSYIFKAERLKDQPAERTRLLELANDLLTGLENTRKEWGKLFVAQGRVADLLGKNEVAIDRFRKAIVLGERQPEIIGRIAELFYLEKRNDDFVKLFQENPEARDVLSGDSDKYIMMLITAGSFAAAEDLAKQRVPDDTTDPEKLLWRARVHWSCKNLKATEPPLRKAYAAMPGNKDAWLGMLQLLVELKKPDEAKTFIETNKDKLKPEESAVILAQAYAAVGDIPKGRELYLKLLEKPDPDLDLIRSASTFLFKAGDTAKAGPLLEKMIKHPKRSPSDEDLARRLLALCVVASRDHRSAVRALGIMGYKTVSAAVAFTGRETIEDLEARFAVLSAIKGREARNATVTILKKIELMVPTLPTDKQLAFARIQFALDDWADARRRFAMAANATDSTPLTIASYANALLRKGELDEAKKLIDRLTTLEPDSVLTAELKARLATLNNNKLAASDVMKKYLTTKDARPELAAQILEHLGLPEDAALILKRMAEAAPADQPEIRMLYAAFLARNGQAVESLAEYEKIWRVVKKEIAVPQLCESLQFTTIGSNSSVAAKTVQMVATAVQAQPNLKPYLAAAKSIVGDLPEAITLSQEVLVTDPNNVYVLNNLAFLLSLKDGKHNEALTRIRQAKELAGPMPTLLDTEALILITAGKPAEAIVLLEEAVVDEPMAGFYVHLAQAYFATGRSNEAILALRQAKKQNLRIGEFHPLERNAVRSLIAQLGG
ncbi:hypothetical protein BH11PLA2_BH11PLA2_42250 [soil metagenome]